MPSWAATYATTLDGTAVGSAKKGAQEVNGGQLQGEAELVVCATPHVDEITVGIVEVKVAGQLLVGWRPNKVAVRARPERPQPPR
jgi:hypothetical protein